MTFQTLAEEEVALLRHDQGKTGNASALKDSVTDLSLSSGPEKKKKSLFPEPAIPIPIIATVGTNAAADVIDYPSS